MRLSGAALAAGLFVGVGCSPPPAPPSSVAQPAAARAWFVDEARSRGVSFVYRSGFGGRRLFPEIMGGGLALADLDADGDLDLLVGQSHWPWAPPEPEGCTRLFRNRGDGTFDDDTPAALGDLCGYDMGFALGDADGDGDLDVYLTRVGASVLLANDGAGRFRDVTREMGAGLSGWSTGAAFFDAEGDGDYDLFVARYVEWSAERELDCRGPGGQPDYCSPQSYDAPAAAAFLRNDGGQFVDRSVESGVAGLRGTGLGVVVASFDGRSGAEIFVANDGMPNRLWRRQNEESYRDLAPELGCAVAHEGIPKAGMGVAVDDLDGDGDPDILVGNLGQETDSLFRNEGAYFTDITVRAGMAAVSRPFTRFGLGFADFDQDGRLDLYEANGRVTLADIEASVDRFAEPNLLFRGLGGGRFAEVHPRGGTLDPLVETSRGAAFGDVDGDGAVDVVVINRDAPLRLLRNVVPDRGNWVLLDVRDRNGAPAIGARLLARAGGETVAREVRSAGSYLSASDPRVHFGLGERSEIQALRITWTDGSTTDFGALAANRIHVLRRPP